MKNILILAIGLLVYAGVNAQSETYPLYYSQYGMNGTAAYIGKAGAIGALGGDIMASHYNPAGLGLFKKSEITFSMGLDITASNSKFNGLKADDNYPSFNYGNLGMVLNFHNENKSPWRDVQISFGIDRYMNFNNRNVIARSGLTSSFISDNIIPNLNGTDDINNDFITSGVIDVDSLGVMSTVYDSGSFNQLKSVRESGYLNEFSMSLSANYENWLYVGATIGIPFGDYTLRTSFSEERFVDNTLTARYNFNTEQRLSAAGVNLKLGAIVKPIDWLRLGAAIHTPTYYSVDDDYFSEVEYNQHQGGWFPTESYSMQTPWRFMGSIAMIFGNNRSPLGGTISADYEYADYSFMSYSIDGNISKENDLNTNIDEAFGGASTIRVGGELRYGRIYGRLGYANFGNPYSSTRYNDASWNYITCGLGYKGKVFTFDLSYAYGHNSDAKYYMYNVYDGVNWLSDPNPATTETTKHLLQMTLGIRF